MSYASTYSAVGQYRAVGDSGAMYADPHRLIEMLMDGALDRMAQAKGAMQRGDVAAKGSLLGKAIAIVGGLQGSLDHGAGGEIAGNLDALYDYMQRRLLQANVHGDEAAVDEVSALMRELRAAWAAMPIEARGAPAAPGTVATTG